MRRLTPHHDGCRCGYAHPEHSQVRQLHESLQQSWFLTVSARHLLGFGEVSYYLGYNAMRDYFPRYEMKPNPECDNKNCVRHQGEYKAMLAALPQVEQTKEEDRKPKHESNEVQQPNRATPAPVPYWLTLLSPV